MTSLVVLLPLSPAGAQTEFDYVLTPDGRSSGAHASAQASLLPAATGTGAEVVAVAPASRLSWHQVELPRGITATSPRLRAVLEGLLEDRLLDDPDALHFALQPQARAGAPAWVATCDRAWLRSAVQVLESAQRPVTRIVPEFAPDDAPALYALGEAEQASLVAVSAEGLMCLPLTPAAMALLPALPDDAPRVAEPGVAALAEQVLGQKVLLQQAPQRWLQAARSGWDLAQADFSSSGRARTFKKIATGWAELLRAPQWRPARWGAVLLVALNLLGLNAWAWKERAGLQTKQETIKRTLVQTFPQVKVIVDAPVQMEKEVAVLRQATGATSGRDLEAMLGALASTAAPGRAVAAIEFNGAELRAKGVASSADETRAIANTVKGMGYAAEWRGGDTLVLLPENAP